MKIDGVLSTAISKVPFFDKNLDAGNNPEDKSFSDMLGAAIQDVNQLQKQSQRKNIDLVAGRVDDISEVMIAAEKASLALQLTTQVRNKVVESYQEIMRMQM